MFTITMHRTNNIYILTVQTVARIMEKVFLGTKVCLNCFYNFCSIYFML